MSKYLVQAILPYRSNLPSDVAVNNFVFEISEGTQEDTEDVISLALTDFYNSGTQKIVSFLSPALRGAVTAEGGLIAKAYKLDDPKPRPPRYELELPLPVPSSGSSLPLEVAAVASFQAPRLAGTIQARRRGRVYLGPLNTNAVTTDGSSKLPLLNSTLVTAIVDACQRLQAGHVVGDASVDWYVWSRVNNDFVKVDNGWVDAEPDTMRSRETRPKSRTLWGVLV